MVHGLLEVGGGWYGDLSHGCFLRRLYVPVNETATRRARKKWTKDTASGSIVCGTLQPLPYISLVPPAST